MIYHIKKIILFGRYYEFDLVGPVNGIMVYRV